MHFAPAVTVDPASSAPVDPGSSFSPDAFGRPSSQWDHNQLANRSATCRLDLVTMDMQHWKMAKDLHTEAIDIGLQRRPQDSSQFAPVSVVGVRKSSWTPRSSYYLLLLFLLPHLFLPKSDCINEVGRSMAYSAKGSNVAWKATKRNRNRKPQTVFSMRIRGSIRYTEPGGETVHYTS